MADTISGQLPAWLAEKTFTSGSQQVSQSIQAGLQYAQQLKASQLQEQAFRLKQQAELDASEGMVELGQVVSEIAKSGDWTSPENKSKFYATAAKHPHVMKTPAFKSLEDNFQLADKAKATEALWSERLGAQQDIASAKLEAQLQAQQDRFDSLLKMEDLKQEHRKEIENLSSENKLLRDSLKPTRTGQLVHDLNETDLKNLAAETEALKLQYQNGDINAKQYNELLTAVQKKYDARRIGTAAPATPGATAKRVKVKSPDGKLFTLPADQLQNALEQGYQQVP